MVPSPPTTTARSARRSPRVGASPADAARSPLDEHLAAALAQEVAQLAPATSRFPALRSLPISATRPNRGWACGGGHAHECTMNRMLDKRAQILLKTLIERYIAEGQPVGSRTLFAPFRARPFAGDDPQRDVGPGGAWASSPARTPPPAACRRRSATASSSTRCWSMKPLQSGRAAPARGRAASGQPAARHPRRLAAAVAAHAVRRRGDDAAPARDHLPPDRVPAPLREAHPAHRRHAPTATCRTASSFTERDFCRFRADRGGQLHQPELRRAELRGRAHAPAAASCASCAAT